MTKVNQEVSMSAFDRTLHLPFEETRESFWAESVLGEERHMEVRDFGLPRSERRPERDRAETRWIDVVEIRPGEQFEATFCLRLAGVSAKRLASERSCEALPSVGEGFDVIPLVKLVERVGAPLCVQLRNVATGTAAIECLIGSRVQNTTRDGAIAAATSLFASMLEATGRADAPYVFEPSSAVRDERSTVIRLTRPSFLVGLQIQGPVGFQSASPASSEVVRQVRIPQFSSWGHIHATTRALSSAGSPICLRFDVTARQLSREDIEGLIRTQVWLAGPMSAGLTYEELAAGGVPKDPGLLEDIERLTLAWIRRPRGVQIHGEIVSSGEVPMALLVALERDFNGLSPLADDASPACLAATLDLSCLAHESLGVPELLPARSSLLDLGTRRVLANGWNDEAAGPIIGRLPGASRTIVRIPEHSRDRSCYIVGATGSGKSTLLYNLIVHDLAAGQGLCLFDPHGELYEWVLHSIPASRREDVRLIDPYDPDWVVGLNPIECRGPNRRWQMQTAVAEFIRILDHLYDLEQKGGPVFETYMRNALFLIMDNPESAATLLDVARVFEDRDYRRALVAACSDLTVADFWTKQAERATGEASLTGITPYITSKLNQFSQNALLAPIVGQRTTTISIPDLLREGRILLVNLSAGHLGVRDAQLLGTLTLTTLLRTAMNLPRTGRRPMHVYMDEFQYFLTDAAADTLAQGRKFGLSLTVAHQHVGQLTTAGDRFGTKLLDAVLGNVATKLLFRVGPRDVEHLRGWVAPDLGGEHLMHLADHDVVACMTPRGRAGRPMVVETFPRASCPYPCADPSEIRELQRRYARPRQVVDAEVFRLRSANDVSNKCTDRDQDQDARCPVEEEHHG
jgi:hypothetical protein